MEYTWVFFVSFLDVIGRLLPILLALIALITINGLSIGRIEGWRPSDSMYHAFINATTVGYGDLRPTQGSSRALSVLNAFMGLLLTGIFVGAGVYAVESAYSLAH